MQVILLKDVEKVGLRGDVVNVARGYARNFLLPRRLAEPATEARVAEIQRRDEQRARHEARTHEEAQKVADLLQRTVLRFEVKSGPTGVLFGSVTPSDIVDELWRTRKVRVDRRKIELADPIKQVGRYDVPVEVFADVRVEVKTLVVPEGGELPPEDEAAAPGTEEATAAPGTEEATAAPGIDEAPAEPSADAVVEPGEGQAAEPDEQLSAGTEAGGHPGTPAGSPPASG